MSKRIENLLKQYGNTFFFGAILFLGTVTKILMFPASNYDLECFLVPWYDHIVGNGRFLALRNEFSDYNVPYLYLLTLATYLPVAKYTAIKLISLLFDFLGAWAAAKIVGLKYDSPVMRMGAFSAVFLAPTVMVNSALWGQCDIIYAGLILWSLYFAFKKKGGPAMIFFGLAFSFKLQALFLLPLAGVFLIKKLIRPRHLIYIPAAFFLLLLPSMALGRSFPSLMSVYIKQSAQGDIDKILNWNCANFYQLFNTDAYNEIAAAGKIIALIACVGILFYAFKIRRSLDNTTILKLGVFNALFVVYFLPGMHERYYFAADLLSILLAFYLPRLFYLPLVINFSSLLSYIPFLKYLRGETTVDLRVLGAAFGLMIIMLVRELARDVLTKDSEALLMEPGLKSGGQCPEISSDHGISYSGFMKEM
ncbi:MAG: hypothetical protein K6U80_05300 [Firmicutes bacterium]|nr:hypothetical protein [Bacillota bacterium]